ncbi:MAG: pyridoxamine 5'-phosphate oxidase family protein [Sciscionella sp.]
MPSRRAAIAMSSAEITTFLSEGSVLTVASMGPAGRPHLAPLWYYPAEHVLRTWTFAKSQKALNLRRDPRATAQVESGRSYEELRGVVMECDVELVEDADQVATIGATLMARYHTGGGPDDPAITAMVRAQAPKRVGLVLRPTAIASWDHRKLGGTY